MQVLDNIDILAKVFTQSRPGDLMQYGDLPVHDAARNDAKELAALIEANPELIYAKAHQGNTPLHVAVKAGNFDAVKILLQAGADVNVLDENGETPAFKASSRKMLELLKQAGAKFDIYSKRGHYGFQNCAAYIHSLEVLEFWWEQGCDINHQPEFAWPAIVGVCAIGARDKEHDYKEEIAMIKFLLEHGADINQQDRKSSGRTALIKSCWEESVPLTKFLLECGADPNFASHSGATALHHAIARKNTKLVELLLAHGADPNQPDKYHFTPIEQARKDCFNLDVLEPLYKPKPEKPIPTADEVITRLLNIPSFSDVELIGCTEEEIAKLEEQFELKLPEAYRYFLKRMGKGAGEFLASDHVSFEYDCLFKLNQDENLKNFCELSANSFVFAEREYCQFFYFEADGSNDDPPVFRFDDAEFGSTQVFRTFWEYIEERVVEYEFWELSR